MCAEVKDKLVGDQSPRSAIFQRNVDCLRCNDARVSHDEFSTARFVAIQVKCDQAVDHVVLALQHFRHIDRYRPGCDAERCSVPDNFCDARTPDLVLTGEAVDVGTGASDPSAFDHRSSVARLRHMPGKILSTFAASDDNHVVPFGFGHHYLLKSAPAFP